MEGENGNASSGAKAGGQIPQKSIESGELVIHCDPHRLENAANG
jgi:hypothetical protein